MWALFYLFTPCKLHLVLQLKLRWLIRREELQRKRTNTAIFSVALQLDQVLLRHRCKTAFFIILLYIIVVDTVQSCLWHIVFGRTIDVAIHFPAVWLSWYWSIYFHSILKILISESLAFALLVYHNMTQQITCLTKRHLNRFMIYWFLSVL